ncbi:MAG: aldehyde dehydrogenase family protein [Caldilineaceae bacterium]|jgi:1-pyrroline-5-carboxylate dehydrogenase|nr:aldehyde dehydrogenase family protein [Caldilineaceae bacterium]
MNNRKHIKVTYSTLGSPDPLLHAFYEDALTAARASLGQTHRLLINGAWVEARTTYTTCSPIDTSVAVGHFQDGDAGDIDRAVRAARAAFPAWRATPWQERVTLLRQVAALISERLFDIAAIDSLEVGKNRLEALGDVEETADFIRRYCDVMEQHNGFVTPQQNETEHFRNTSLLKPYGVWGVISPFNFPVALSGGPVAAALLAGNTVVLKPAEDTPFSPTLLMACFVDAGVPAGVVNMVTGQKETGRALVDHPDVDGFTFTGSYRVGMEIYAKIARGARPRPVITEMGGKNPAIVAQSANLDMAAQGVARAAFGLTGQKCSACSRVYVHASVKDAFLAKLTALAEQVQIGDPTHADNWMGPVINRRAYENYQIFTAELAARGRILTGGKTLAPHGYYVAPTVVTDLPEEHPLWKQEMFLPIVAVASFDDFDNALRRANDVDFGLTAGCYTRDQEEAQRFLDTIEAGVIYLNRATSATTGAWPGYQPFGGWKGSSNTSKGAGGPYYLQQYLREQSQTVVSHPDDDLGEGATWRAEASE